MQLLRVSERRGSSRFELDICRECPREVLLRDSMWVPIGIIDDRDRGPPVSLTREAPVTEAVVLFSSGISVLDQVVYDIISYFTPFSSSELLRILHDTFFIFEIAVFTVFYFLCFSRIIRMHDRIQWDIMLFCESKISFIMC